jgi:NTE family protein
MRASMAIPTAFTSVDVDTTLFVDGGIVNNFPVEILKEMGADIIIGVNVSSSGFEKAKDINNIPGILMQMAMINSLKRLPEQIKACDIYIEPDLKGYSTASFSSYNEILEVGDRAGEKFYPQFVALANELNMHDSVYIGLSVSKVEAITIDEVVLNGNTRTPDYVVLGKLGIKADDIVTLKHVELGVRSIYGLNNFDKVVYHIDKVPGKDRHQLIINMKEKTPASLLATVHYDNTFSAGVVLNLTLKNVLLKGSRAVFLADISENPKFRFDYLKYMGKTQHYALNTIYDYKLLQIPTYDKGEVKDLIASTIHNFIIQAITTQSLKHSFSVGYEFSSFFEKSKFAFNLPEGIDRTRLIYNKIIGSYFRNSLNDRNFPIKGSSTEIILKAYLGNNYSVKFKSGVNTVDLKLELEDTVIYVPVTQNELNDIIKEELQPQYFLQLYLNHQSFTDFSSKFQVVPRVSVGLTISTGKENAFYNEFRMGGVQQIDLIDAPVYGLNYGEVFDNNFALVGLSFQNVLFKNLYVQYGANLMVHHSYVPLDKLSLFDWDNMINNNSLFGYGFNLRYKSFIGPISFGMSRNTNDSYFRFYFQLGYSFNYRD